MDCKMQERMPLVRQTLSWNGTWRSSFPGVVTMLAAAVLLAGACSCSEPKSGGKTLSEHFELLKSPDPEVRRESAHSIHSLAQTASDMNDFRHFKHRLPELLEALQDPDSEVRERIAWAFFLLRELTPGAIPQLLELARSDPEPSIRGHALHALGRARADQMDRVLPFLLEVMQNTDDLGESREAAFTLGLVGPPAAPAIPAMVKICPEKDTPWCQHFHIALDRIDPNWRERPEVQALLATTPAIGEDTPSSPEPER
jgi:hypothetical protein